MTLSPSTVAYARSFCAMENSQPVHSSNQLWNQWQLCRGIGGRLAMESVATLPWNTHPSGPFASGFVVGLAPQKIEGDMAKHGKGLCTLPLCGSGRHPPEKRHRGPNATRSRHPSAVPHGVGELDRVGGPATSENIRCRPGLSPLFHDALPPSPRSAEWTRTPWLRAIQCPP